MALLKIGILNKTVTIPTTASPAGIYFVNTGTIVGIYIVSLFSGSPVVTKIFNSGDWYGPANFQAGNQYLSPTGSAAGLTGLPTLGSLAAAAQADLLAEVNNRNAGDVNLQSQITGLSSAFLGSIAYNASAPTPAMNGWFEFSTGGVVSWLAGTPTVKAGDRVTTLYTAPSTYLYTYTPVDFTNQDYYNVSVRIPLSAGSYYTPTTARAAVPSTNKKVGLIITYLTAAGISRSEQFIGASTGTWSTDLNWKLLSNADDIYYTSNAIGASFIQELYVFGSLVGGKIYYVGGVGRGATTYNWFLYISESNPDGSSSRIVAYLVNQLSEPTGIITIPAYSSSGISAQILVNWSVFTIPTNITPNWILNARSFNLSLSPNLFAASIEVTNAASFAAEILARTTGLNSKLDIAAFITCTQTVYQHPRGSSEFVGNMSYPQNAVGCWCKPNSLSFNMALVKAAIASGTALVYINIYKGPLPIGSGTIAMSGLTLLYSTSQTWDNDITKTRTILMPSAVTVASTDYIYILYSTLSATNVVQVGWNTNPNSDRTFLLYKSSTDYPNEFTGNWTGGTIPTYGQVQPILYLTSPFALESDLLALGASALISTGGKAELMNDCYEFIHPRGLTEHFGNHTYFNLTGVCQHMLIARNMWVKRLSASVFCPGFTGTINVMVNTTGVFSADPAIHTLVEAIPYNSANLKLSTTGTVLTEIILSAWLDLKAGTYLYLYFVGAAGNMPTLLNWTINSSIAPYRTNQFIYWDGSAWDLSNPGYKYCCPILLKNDNVPWNAIPSTFGANVMNPRITLISNIYSVVGTELNIFYDAIVLGSDNGLASPKEYDIEVICSKGVAKQRCWAFTPISGDVGTYSFVINVYDYNHTLLSTKSITLNVIAATAPASVKNILNIGDSLTAPGVITQTIHDNFVALGSNTPNFCGFTGVAPILCEGIGGWTFLNFATAGPSYYKFLVSGVTSVMQGSVYSNNGSQFTIREVNIVGGTGYIKGNLSSGTNAPLSLGTLSKVSGSGDAVINYSAEDLEAGNPLWNPSTSALDIANYRSNLGMGAAKFDGVTLQLGINESFGSIASDASITNIINYAKAICTAFLADNSGTKIVIMLPSTDANTSFGWGQNYGASGYKYTYQMNIWRLRELMITNFDAGAFNANVSLGIAGLAIDRYWGYQQSAQAISARISTTEPIHINAVHPATVGYQQMGDSIFAQLLFLLR